MTRSPSKTKAFELANRRGVSTSLLTYISRKYYDDWYVCKRIAGNPAVSSEILKKLAVHPMLSVRGAVASNRRTPHFLLEQLARDDEWLVRWTVAQNPSTPEPILVRFIYDGFEDEEDERVVQTANDALLKRTTKRLMQEIKNSKK